MSELPAIWQRNAASWRAKPLPERWSGVGGLAWSSPFGIDLVLLGATLALTGFGALVVHSATRSMDGIDSGAFAVRQAIFLALGVVALVVTAAVDLRRVRALAAPLWVGALALLVAVLSPLGTAVNGARSWFDLGPFQLQPAEPAKVAVVLALAAYLAAVRRPGHGGLGARSLVVALVLVGLPSALIVLQPDVGSTSVFLVIALGVLGVAGVRLRQVVLLGALAAAGLGLVLATGLVEGYQRDRLTTFASPERGTEAGEAGYNLDQAQTAIGNGGLTGTGLFEGTQTRGRYVPEQQTDFIFPVVGEELGLVGGISLLVLLGAVCWRVWLAAWAAEETFARLLCVGILSILLFQVFQNVGMAMGIMPITGLPLPFVSYGGSSLISMLAALGLVLNVRRQQLA